VERPADLDSAGVFSDKHTLMRAEGKVREYKALLGKGWWNAVVLGLLLCPGCASLKKSECDEIVSANTESFGSRSYEQKGIRLADKARWAPAAEAFEQAIALDRNNGSAHNNLGLAYYHQRKLALAAAEFELASGLLPEDPAPLNNLGMTLEAAGRGVDSLEYYAQAHELAPDKPLYLGNLVRNRIRLGDRDESIVDQLKHLLFIETRPEWVEWIEDQLVLENNPMLDRGPPPPNLNSTRLSNSMQTSNPTEKPLFSNPSSHEAANELLNLTSPAPIVHSPRSN
jgi:tetratricopeptide (TPR) repeat protein